MIGAIIGDIAGSRFEWHNHKSKEFELFTNRCGPTDDSIMTLAVAKAIMNCAGDTAAWKVKPSPVCRSMEDGIRMPAMEAAFIVGSFRAIRSPTTAMETVPPCVSVPAGLRQNRWRRPLCWP